MQTPDEQYVVVQSVPVRHFFPEPQAVQVPPPQSTSVSLPFWTASLHAGVRQVPLQTPEVQSLAAVHVLLSTHFGQPPPPQSTSVSLPFFARSVQLGVAHVVPLQTALAQSVGMAHP
ncbi:MAG TPA: hypothetical protein VHE30_15075 [Polyangiaceae bacterium]|nr:hypothetical protein [Polyangiaceae bacterium]